MSERLRVRARGIGDLRLGADAGPAATRTLRFCVGEPENEAVSAVTDDQGAIRLITTTAPEHRARGVGADSLPAAVRGSYPHIVSLGKGLLRASSESTIVFVKRRGVIRRVAVADEALVAHRATLRQYLRLAR
jgi:hypothetical protein